MKADIESAIKSFSLILVHPFIMLVSFQNSTTNRKKKKKKKKWEEKIEHFRTPSGNKRSEKEQQNKIMKIWQFETMFRLFLIFCWY